MNYPCPFEDRPIEPGKLIQIEGWSIKTYSIWRRDLIMDNTYLAQGVEHFFQNHGFAENEGVGFVIHHFGESFGKRVHYIVMNAWEGNELRTFTLVNFEEGSWHFDPKNYSPCVWDLEVIWHERNSFINHLMTEPQSIEAYLSDSFHRD